MAVTGGERAAQHQDRRDQRHRAGAADGEHEVGDDGADGFQRLANPHARHHRECVGHRLDDPGIARGVRVGFGQGRDMGMRRTLERIGGKYQHEIDAETLPVHGAQIADPGRDIAAEHVDDEFVADLQSEPIGNLFLHRNQRGPVIVGTPPIALDHLRTPRDFAGIGQAAVALQHPFGVGRGFEVFRLDAAGGDDASAQHRHVFDGRLRRGFLEECAEAAGFGGGNIDEIE